MSDEPKTPPPAPAASIDEDRRAILARRSFFVAAAVAGLARAQMGCAACLSPTTNFDSIEDSGAETAPQPCLGMPLEDSGRDASDAAPQPCLTAPPLDAGDASDASDASDDAGADSAR